MTAEQERERIVAWLRVNIRDCRRHVFRMETDGDLKNAKAMEFTADMQTGIAEAIQRGEHWEGVE